MKLENKDNEYTTVDFESWNAMHLCVAFCPVVVVGIAMILAWIYL